LCNTYAVPCERANECSSCTLNRSCSWCTTSCVLDQLETHDCFLVIGCYWSMDSGCICNSTGKEGCNRACSTRVYSRKPDPVFEHITVALLLCCCTIYGFLILATIGYAFWKFYWSRRHFYVTLK